METQKILHEADLHLSTGKAEEAIAIYDSALAHDRNFYSAWLGKGTALKFLHRIKYTYCTIFCLHAIFYYL